MLEEILPPAVAAVEAFGDVPDAVLFPAEEAALGRAVDERRREFSTVRACAREALARLGLPPVPIVPGLRGAPQWPSGIVGSMTHCAGYRASAVARMQDMLILGLDAEPDHRLPDGVLDAIATADERAGTVRPRVRGADAILGPAAVQRQGVGLQGMVPADPALAGLR